MKSYRTDTGFDIKEWYNDNLKLEKNMLYLNVKIEKIDTKKGGVYKFNNLGKCQKAFMNLLTDVVSGLKELTYINFSEIASSHDVDFEEIEDFCGDAFKAIKSAFVEQGLDAALNVKGTYAKALELSILLKNLKYKDGEWSSCGRKWIDNNGIAGFKINELDSPDLETGCLKSIIKTPSNKEREFIEVEEEKKRA